MMHLRDMDHGRPSRRPRAATASASSVKEEGDDAAQAPRLRRAHKKSRNGCSNCKMRSVKCDESKPSCKRCQAYRVTCSYVTQQRSAAKDLSYPGEMSFDISCSAPVIAPDPGAEMAGRKASTDSSSSSSSIGELQIKMENETYYTFTNSTPNANSNKNKNSSSEENRTTSSIRLGSPSAQLPNQIWAVLPLAEPDTQKTCFEVQSHYHDLYQRFVTRTLKTLMSKQTRTWYNTRFLGVVQRNPALLHMCFAFTILHDTHLSASPPSPWMQSTLSFHWYHGAALFLKQLKVETDPDAASRSSLANVPFVDDEALWMASVLLSVSALSNVNTLGPTSAWPLKAPGPLDLDWLKLIYGKRAVWERVNTNKPDTLFAILQGQSWWQEDPETRKIQPNILPEAFTDLFGLGGDPPAWTPYAVSNPPMNPYYNAAALLSQMLPIPTSEPSLFPWQFISGLSPPLRALLEVRDPRALLLLLYWYAKVAPMPIWWLRRRAVVEGLAVWEYLRTQCQSDLVFLSLLAWPLQELSKVAKADELLDVCAKFVDNALGESGFCFVS